MEVDEKITEITKTFRLEIMKNRLLNGVCKSLLDSNKTYSSVCQNTINEIGSIGESLYNSYLIDILDTDMEDISIDWVNEDAESGKPYDFKISIGNETFYIDVKSTKGKSENDIHMSKREYKFALNEPNYYIARLYEWETDRGKLRAGNFNVKVLNLYSVLHLLKIK
jgi:hypothetical protein